MFNKMHAEISVYIQTEHKPQLNSNYSEPEPRSALFTKIKTIFRDMNTPFYMKFYLPPGFTCLDFFCSGIRVYVLFGPFLCFISFVIYMF